MTKEEIEKVKAEVAEAENQKVDLVLEEEAIATMAESEGWKIMVKKANKTICELLEPIDTTQVPADANHLLIIANSFANARTLKIFREFLNEVETIRTAKRYQQSLQAGESKSEAQ